MIIVPPSLAKKYDQHKPKKNGGPQWQDGGRGAQYKEKEAALILRRTVPPDLVQDRRKAKEIEEGPLRSEKTIV